MRERSRLNFPVGTIPANEGLFQYLPALRHALLTKKNSVQVQAVDDEGLRALLGRLGALESLGRDARCFSCGRVVTIDTIAAVYPENREIRYICTNEKCSIKLSAGD